MAKLIQYAVVAENCELGELELELEVQLAVPLEP
jgi:hypothetical protein